MCKVLIFGGTTEGRLLAEFCEENSVHADISVATEYGEKLLSCGKFINILVGRLDFETMKNLISGQKYRMVIDATHPYATEVTDNIKKASAETDTPYFRLIRQNNSIDYGIKVHSMHELINELNSRDGIILSTLGSKELDALTAVRNYYDRIWIRALPSFNVSEMCAEKGFDTEKLILEKGPFTSEQNTHHIKLCGAEILITKESGNVGGFDDKVKAAKLTGITMITLARPVEQGFTYEQILKILENYR